MKYYLEAWKNATNFKGYTTRTGFWLFHVINIALIIIFLLLIYITDGAGLIFISSSLRIIYTMYVVATLLPIIAIAIRRLHDAGFSGWWYLLVLIPGIGFLIMICFYLLKSKTENNKYRLSTN